MKKLNGEFITARDVHKRKARSFGMGYAEPPKWIQFAEAMLKDGYKVAVKETGHTFSKYVTVHGAGDVTFKVRFSDHKPIKHRELEGDCDFFVGVTHTGVRTTTMAIEAVKEFFNAL